MANQRGNILVRQGEHEQAVGEYEAAIRLDPQNPAYKENCAAACIELDMIHRAEELLAQVEPEHPSPSVYNLLGNVAILKGERARAEARLQCRACPGQGQSRSCREPRAAAQRPWQPREGEGADARRARGHTRSRAGPSLLERIRDEHEKKLACASCGRSGGSRRPASAAAPEHQRRAAAQAPAGRCPHCGKVYCVSCASAHVREMRFFCPDCNETSNSPKTL